MTKHSLETKLKAIYAYLEGTESIMQTAQKYGVSKTLLHKWVVQFREQGLEAFQTTYTNYSFEFKMDVIHYMNDTGASYLEAATKFHVPSPQTVWKWKHLVDTEGIDALQPKEKGRPIMNKKSKKNQPVEGSEEALRAENERLRMENAYLKKLHALIQEKEQSQNRTKRK